MQRPVRPAGTNYAGPFTRMAPRYRPDFRDEPHYLHEPFGIGSVPLVVIGIVVVYFVVLAF